LERFAQQMEALKSNGNELIICGDYNIAHRNIDLKNWRGNQKNSGFLPEERAWLDHVFDTIGLVDAFRVLNQEPDQYTWWSMRQRAWEKNVGWRIDYQMITPGLVSALQTVSIYREQPFSDHAPLIMTYDVTV
jgi:exodeoxyribonuclease-3